MSKSIKTRRLVVKAKQVLESFGYSFLEYIEYKDNKQNSEIWISFESDYLMDCELSNIISSKSAREIESLSTWYSCCGDELDHDIPICPSCKEWC